MSNPAVISGFAEPAEPVKPIEPKVFISLLSGSGSVKIDTMSSLIMSIQWMIQNRIRYEIGMLAHITGVDSARNISTEIFMQTDCTHMLMIDDDIAWAADLPIRLLQENVDIVGVPYKTKNVKRPRWTARHTVDEQHCISADRLHMMRLDGLGTGMLLVRRGVFETLKATVPKAKFSDADKILSCYFQHEINPDTQQMQSEDFVFCRRAREAGYLIWGYVDEEIAHIGNYAYTGNYADMLDTDETKFRYNGVRQPLRVILE